MGIGPIPFTAIAEYFRIYELDDFDEFAYIIRRMDSVFLELNAADKADKPEGGKTSASSNTNKKNNNQGGRGRVKGGTR